MHGEDDCECDEDDYFHPNHPEHEAFWRHINHYLDATRVEVFTRERTNHVRPRTHQETAERADREA